MSFLIINENPLVFKDYILKMWEENLPGTSPQRLDWMNGSYPAGPSVWYFALEPKTSVLAGVISAMPKDLFFDGKKTRARIFGDFMSLPKYRAFGPA